jgi:ribonuclease HI
MIEIYCDGCCEPINPGGYASYGLVILKDGKEIFKEGRLAAQGKEASNNVAEYSGLLAALLWLYKNNLQNEEIRIRSDSMLVVKQMAGEWNMNKGIYIPIALRCKEGVKKFSNITFEWIPREKNYLADDLSKAVLKKMNVKFKIQPDGK